MLNEIVNDIKPLDKAAMDKAQKYQDSLVKPPKSLGKLEDISVKFAGITGRIKNKAEKKIHFVLGADNGIYEEGVSSAPQEFSRILLGYYAEGQNCGINVLCKLAGADLVVVDMGVIGEIDAPNLIRRKFMDGTKNFAKEPAMAREIAVKAIEAGIELARYAKDNRYDVIGAGEVGMGNTTSSAACLAAALGIGAEKAAGRGAGLTDEAFQHKVGIIDKAIALHKPDANDPIDILSKVGGLDIAGLTGLFIGAAHFRIPIIIDGFISSVAALLAYKMNPLAKEYMIPSHISEEPGYAIIMKEMSLNPMLDLSMRLGEGTGCPLAMQLIDASLAIISEMLSFDASILDEETYKNNLTGGES